MAHGDGEEVGSSLDPVRRVDHPHAKLPRMSFPLPHVDKQCSTRSLCRARQLVRAQMQMDQQNLAALKESAATECLETSGSTEKYQKYVDETQRFQAALVALTVEFSEAKQQMNRARQAITPDGRPQNVPEENVQGDLAEIHSGDEAAHGKRARESLTALPADLRSVAREFEGLCRAWLAGDLELSHSAAAPPTALPLDLTVTENAVRLLQRYWFDLRQRVEYLNATRKVEQEAFWDVHQRKVQRYEQSLEKVRQLEQAIQRMAPKLHDGGNSLTTPHPAAEVRVRGQLLNSLEA